MCGIFSYFVRPTSDLKKQQIINSAMKIQHRGPDETHIIHGNLPGDMFDTYHLIFHRLMINGLSPESGQPLVYPSEHPYLYLLCNGEIYNYQELVVRESLALEYHSKSDCEIILHLYHRYGIEKTLDMIKGVFAFVILDTKANKIVMARDPLGVRSLYYSVDQYGFGLCSELKGLYDLADPAAISQFPGGCYGSLDYDSGSSKLSLTRYYDITAPVELLTDSEQTICKTLSDLFINAVRRRMMCDRTTSDGRPTVGAYLSGGFDSSVVAAVLADCYPGQLETFSIGFADAPDLINARLVAEYIGSKHHEYVITEQEALEGLYEVTRQIESYDVTTNRASTFMYLLSKYIQRKSDTVVVLSGEGSDEMFGSYMYFHNAPSDCDFHQETLRLLKDLQYFDLLRGDKSSAVAGLEIRVPFLDIDLINYVRRIPPKLKMAHGIEKYIIRKAMSQVRNSAGEPLLPDSILWRTKEAMSDGVSLHQRSWNTIIQAHLLSNAYSSLQFVVSSEEADQTESQDPVDLEKVWLKNRFISEYPGCAHTIPYEWLPKWCGDVKDSSARVLDVYKQKNDQEQSHNEILS